MEKEELKDIKDNSIRLRSWMQFLIAAAIAILVYAAGSVIHFRIDLTEENRFTLSPQTHAILDNLKNDVYIQVFLDGEMPVQFKKLRRSVIETLDEFRIASGRKVDYTFINPSADEDGEKRADLYESLSLKGLNPIRIMDNDDKGASSQRIIFPGLIINYNGIEIPVNFLKNNITLSPEQNIQNSIEGLEYELIQTIATVAADTVYKVAFIEGQGEYSEIEVADITLELAKYFTVDRGVINATPGILDSYSAIIIAGPVKSFDEADKLVIDQYIMNGGKVLWMFEEVDVNQDSLYMGETAAIYHPLNLEDMLFKYGARINPSLVQDLECNQLPVKIITGGSSQLVPLPWLYYPLLSPDPRHPLTRNLNRVSGKYVNYIDTVGLDHNIHKTILLRTSPYSRTVNPPLLITLKEAEATPDGSLFNKTSLPVALLLEGKFQSAYRNRIIENLLGNNIITFKGESFNTKMIVISDADIIRNDVAGSGSSETFLPLGQDRYTMETFGNKEFLINCLNYLVDDYGLMELRGRELKLRLLNKQAVARSKLLIRLINVAGPVILVILAGILFSLLRKRKYTVNQT